MAGTKRKAISSDTANHSSNSKRVKQEDRVLPLRIKDQETATDSDPIVESDTTEHSGAEDGESWPSDYEAEEVADSRGAVNGDSGNADSHETSRVALPKG